MRGENVVEAIKEELNVKVKSKVIYKGIERIKLLRGCVSSAVIKSLPKSSQIRFFATPFFNS